MLSIWKEKHSMWKMLIFDQNHRLTPLHFCNLCFSLFLPKFRCESWFIVKIFRNRKFSILRISCSRSGRFYFRLRTDQACAEQLELQDFCGRDLMSPESFWHCPADQKAWRLWVLEWHQVHNIWSKKKERAEKKRGESGSSQLVKTGEKEHALFSLWAGHIWYSPTGNSWLWNLTFVYLKDWQGM